MSGWIKLHRSIQQHWLYTEKRCFSRFEAWNDILLTVNYSDAQTFIKGKVYNVKRGESILSLDSWASRWNWDKSKVRRFLTLLQNEKMIVLKSDNITTHLIVCKYEDYQDSSNANETQMKRRRNANDIQTTPIEEEKEIKEGNNVLKQPKIDVNNFLEWFNSMKLKHKGVKGKFKTLRSTDINNLHKLKQLKYDSNDWEYAFKMMCKNKWVIDNDMITPSHYLVDANFQKYMNQVDKTEKIDFVWNR